MFSARVRSGEEPPARSFRLYHAPPASTRSYRLEPVIGPFESCSQAPKADPHHPHVPHYPHCGAVVCACALHLACGWQLRVVMGCGALQQQPHPHRCPAIVTSDSPNIQLPRGHALSASAGKQLLSRGSVQCPALTAQR
jgi:hypothetical protein